MANTNMHSLEASLEGHPVTGEAKASPGWAAPTTPLPKTDAGLNLFVANLSADVSDELFREVFGQHGAILSAKVMLDIHTGISRGFGFVLYANEAEGLHALTELQGKSIGKRENPMVITKAQTTGRNAVNDTPKLHMRNVPKHVSEADLNALLAKYGHTERVIMKEDGDTPPQVTSIGGQAASSPTSRGAAMQQSAKPSETWRVFVQYTSAAEANAAVAALHNSKPWPDMVVPLMAKPAETPEMRQLRKARQEGRKPGSQQMAAGSNDRRGGGGHSSPGGSVSPGGLSVQVGPHQQQHVQQQQQHQSLILGTGLRPLQAQTPAGGSVLSPGGMMAMPAQQQQPMMLVQHQGQQQPPAPPGYPGAPQASQQQAPVGIRQFQPAHQAMSMSDSTEFSLTNSFGGSWNWGHMPTGSQPNLMLVNGQTVQAVHQPAAAQFMVPPHLQQPMAQQQPHYIQMQQQQQQQPLQHQPQPFQQGGTESLVPVFPAPCVPAAGMLSQQHFIHVPPSHAGGGSQQQPQAQQQQQQQQPQQQQQQLFGSHHSLPPANGARQPVSPLVQPLDLPASPHSTIHSVVNLEASMEEMSRSGGLSIGLNMVQLGSQQTGVGSQQPIGAAGTQVLTAPVAAQPTAAPQQQQFVVVVPQQHR